jgi:hypothetical protein
MHMLRKPKGFACWLVAESPSLRRCSVPRKHSSSPPGVRLLARVAESPSRPATVQPKAPRHRCLPPPPPPPANGSHTDPSHGMRIRHHPRGRRGRPGTSTESPLSPEQEGKPPAPVHVGASRAPDVVATPPRSITNKARSHCSSTARAAANHHPFVCLCINTHLMAPALNRNARVFTVEQLGRSW